MAPPPFDPPDARAPAEFAGGARAPSPVAARPDGQLPHGHRRPMTSFFVFFAASLISRSGFSSPER